MVLLDLKGLQELQDLKELRVSLVPKDPLENSTLVLNGILSNVQLFLELLDHTHLWPLGQLPLTN